MALVRAVEHIDQHGVDAEAGRVQTLDGHVGGGIAQVAAALFAADDWPVDAVPVAQHGGGVAGAAFGQGVADGGGGDLAIIAFEKRGDGDVEAHVLPEPPQMGGGAGTALAEAEIGADDDVRQAQTVGDDVAGKFLGREAGEGSVEVELVEPFDAELGETVGARLVAHQAKGGASGAKYSRGCGSNVSTPRGPSPLRARSITDWWPRCTPSKFPMATEAPRS